MKNFKRYSLAAFALCLVPFAVSCQCCTEGHETAHASQTGCYCYGNAMAQGMTGCPACSGRTMERSTWKESSTTTSSSTSTGTRRHECELCKR